MAADSAPSPSGRSLGYLYEQIVAARAAAVELESMWDNDFPVTDMARQASTTEDRFVELRVKLYGLAETIDS